MLLTVTTATTNALSSETIHFLASVTVAISIALLVQKEVVSGLSGPRARRLGQALDISLFPLVIVAIITAVMRMVELVS
jgi:hypothetical protein